MLMVLQVLTYNKTSSRMWGDYYNLNNWNTNSYIKCFVHVNDELYVTIDNSNFKGIMNFLINSELNECLLENIFSEHDGKNAFLHIKLAK